MVNAKYHKLCTAVLAKLSVYPGLNGKPGRIGKFLRGNNTRPHGKKSIQAFAEIPLLMTGLKGSGAHIIDHRITENIIFHLGDRHIFCVLSNNNRQFSFVIQILH